MVFIADMVSNDSFENMVMWINFEYFVEFKINMYLYLNQWIVFVWITLMKQNLVARKLIHILHFLWSIFNGNWIIQKEM